MSDGGAGQVSSFSTSYRVVAFRDVCSHGGIRTVVLLANGIVLVVGKGAVIGNGKAEQMTPSRLRNMIVSGIRIRVMFVRALG